MLVASALLLAGCGDSGDGDEDQAASSPATVAPTTTIEPPSGPLVRVCDRALAREALAALSANGFDGPAQLKPKPSGNARLSRCDLGDALEISIDAAPDAFQRYQNRIAESAQFSVGRRHFAPQAIRGVGSSELRDSGANWIPWLKQMISTRGKGVLIVNVSAHRLSDAERLESARTISLAVYRRLGQAP